jgi:hypothetical protein
MFRRWPRVAILVLGLGLLFGVQPGGAAEDGFVKIFNGKDLSGLKIVPESAKDTFKAEDGVLKVSGKPNGYFYTEKSYKNFVVRFEWRYPEKAGNSGLLVYIQPPHKVWPKCVEVQGAYGSHGQIFAIGGAKGKYTDDKDARKKALKPHQEWNTTEVVSMNGKLIEFRNIVIKELK